MPSRNNYLKSLENLQLFNKLVHKLILISEKFETLLNIAFNTRKLTIFKINRLSSDGVL